MKRLLGLLITLFTLVSCSNLTDDTLQSEDHIVVQPTTEILFPFSESAATLTVESSGEWYVDGTTDWCSATPESGSNGDIITISVTNNESATERSTTLTLHCGAAEVSISIVQERLSKTNYVDLRLEDEGTTLQYNSTSGVLMATYADGNVPVVRAGHTVILPAEHMYDIRVIEGASKADNTLTLETTQGNMCNLFMDTDFTLTTNTNARTAGVSGTPVITPCQIGYLDAEGNYYEVYNKANDATRLPYDIPSTLWSFEKDYNNDVLYESELGTIWWEKCEFSGELNGLFSFDFGTQTDDTAGTIGDLERFSYELNGSIGADLLLHYTLEESFEYTYDEIIAKNVLPKKVFKFQVGAVIVPIVVHTHLGQYTEVGGEGTIDISGGVEMKLGLTAGLAWDKNSGIEVIKGADTSLDPYATTLTTEASTYVKTSYYPQIEIGLYGFIGPWLEPRSYLKDEVSAGMRASTDGIEYISWQEELFSGVDMRMGLDFNFGKWDVDVWSSDIFSLVGDTLIAESPSRLSLTSHEDDEIIVEEVESINIEYKVEAYSPLTNAYWPSANAVVVLESENGILSNEVVLANKDGIARVEWTPVDIHNNTSNKITAYIYDSEGEVIDSTTLTIKYEEVYSTIYYSSNSGMIYINEGAFDANIISHTYEDEIGVITFDGELTTIGRGAFFGCSNLVEILLPDSITTIESMAFFQCSSLIGITIPDSVTSIGESAFTYCSSIEAFYGKFASEDNCCLIVDGKMIAYAIGNSATEYTIPDCVTSIEVGAATQCSTLKSLTIPDSVHTIKDNAFAVCNNLTSLTLGCGLKNIGYSAFAYCRNLLNVTLPDSVSNIDWGAFSYCENLRSIELPDTISLLPESIFCGCTSLQSIEIPNSVSYIAASAFFGCSSLRNVTIPNSVSHIDEKVFYGCSSLYDVTIPTSVNYIGEYAFAYCSGMNSLNIQGETVLGAAAFTGCTGKLTIKLDTIPGSSSASESPFYKSAFSSIIIDGYPNSIEDYIFAYCEYLTSITIPSSVDTIKSNAFRNCIRLHNITIPSAVNNIESYAFYNCSSMTQIVCLPAIPPSLGSNAFKNLGYGCKIYVPKSSEDLYKERWDEYKDDIIGA